MSEQVYLKVDSRHVGQLGRELVTDYVTALTELVKNAYDADAEAVQVDFINLKTQSGKILIVDTGKGFTRNDIIDKWAVIGTSNKVKEPYTKKYKRRCSGRKGIGRFSVERLGEYFTLYSVTEDGQAIKYSINWNNFEGIDLVSIKHAVAILRKKPDLSSAKKIKIELEYVLNNLEIDEEAKNIISTKILGNKSLDYMQFYNSEVLDAVEEFLYPVLDKYQGEFRSVDKIPTTIEIPTSEECKFLDNYLNEIYQKNGLNKVIKCGTVLEIGGLRDEWNEKDLNKVFKELRGLISPIQADNNFSIYINSNDYQIEDLKLSNDILDLRFAYIKAIVDNDNNKLSINFNVQGKEISNREEILFENDSAICGDFSLELYYFLRDENLTKGDLKIRAAQKLLNEYCGVKIYRDGFRVRPYGEVGNDWLLLDNKKIKSTHRYLVGNNQLIGIINISSDQNPLLVDSTNREAIIENEAFEQIKTIVLKCIDVIVSYRYKLYEEEKKKDRIPQIEEKQKKNQDKFIKELASYNKKINTAAERAAVKSIPALVSSMLSVVADERTKNEKFYSDIKKQYDVKLKQSREEVQLYRNLASLGILAGSFGHETDDALSRTRTNLSFVKRQVKKLDIKDNDLDETIKDLEDDNDRVINYSYLLLNFIKRKKRKVVYDLSIKNTLTKIIENYDKVIKSYNLKIDIDEVKHDFFGKGIRQIDIESILINLLTNAFEALKKVPNNRVIKFSTEYIELASILRIIVEDSGCGIQKDKREWIFMPLKTTKDEEGVGLGLTIVKDIVEENDGRIIVEDSFLGGAKFIVEFNMESNCE